MLQLVDKFNRCENVWVPRWFREFSDDKHGGFHERLGADSLPLPLPKRLLTQCRQLMVYSQYVARHPNEEMEQKLKAAFDFICDSYRNIETGGFHFSLGVDGKVSDKTYDLYGHAFVLLACAAYNKKFNDPRALKLGREVLDFINEKFRLKNAPGLAEALDEDLVPVPAVRRQNPHMHLMEASIYMYESSGDQAYLNTARDMLSLFESYLRGRDGMISEFFDDNLLPHPDQGNLVETGHHSEWVWLLSRYQDVTGCQDSSLQVTMRELFSWVATNGFDPQYNGICNSQNKQGQPVDSDKRIWPVLETLRASAIMTHDLQTRVQAKEIFDRTLALLDLYVDPDGGWIEYLRRDLSSKTDYRPGTTPYHIYLPLLEAVGKLKL